MNGNPITAEMRADTLVRIADGQTMASICRQPDYPARQTMVTHFSLKPEWQDAYRQARRDGFDAIAEDLFELMAKPYETVGETGKIDPAVVQARKLEVDGKLKLLAKWDPIRYGELLKLSGDPSNPFPIGVSSIPADIDPLTAAQLYKKAIG
jgi:hypothetical protein